MWRYILDNLLCSVGYYAQCMLTVEQCGKKNECLYILRVYKYLGRDSRAGVQQPAAAGHGGQQGAGSQDQGLHQPPLQAGGGRPQPALLAHHV